MCIGPPGDSRNGCNLGPTWDNFGNIFLSFWATSPTHSSTRQLTQPSPNETFNQPSLQTTKPSTNQVFNQPSLQSTKPSTNQAFNQPTLQPTKPSTNQVFNLLRSPSSDHRIIPWPRRDPRSVNNLNRINRSQISTTKPLENN